MGSVSNIAGFSTLRPFSRITPRVLLFGACVGGAGSLLLAGLTNVVSPVVALLAMIGIVVAVGMILSPTFALLVVAFTVPFERIGRLTNDVDPIAISVNRIFGVIALIGLLVHFTLRKKNLRFGLAFYLYASYTALAFLSNVWAFTPEETFRDCFRVTGNLLCFFLIWNLVRDYDGAKRAVVIWLVASMAAAVYSLAQYYLTGANALGEMQMGLTSQRMTAVVSDMAEARSIGESVRRLFGTTAHPTLCGVNNCFTIPFFLWAMQTQRTAWKVFWAIGLVLAAACIVLSNTRAVFLLLAFMVVFCFVRRLGRPNLKGAIALAIVGLALVPLIPRDVYLRALNFSLYTTEKGDAIRVRFKFWEKSWELIQDNWWHGIGLGDETTLQKMVTDEDTGYLSTAGLKASAHNEYIWVMVELGLFGYLLHWGFVGLVIRRSFQTSSMLRTEQGMKEQYLFMIACQSLLLAIPAFAVQSEAFHYPIKGWWMTAGLACAMFEVTRRRQAAQRMRLDEAVIA